MALWGDGVGGGNGAYGECESMGAGVKMGGERGVCDARTKKTRGKSENTKQECKNAKCELIHHLVASNSANTKKRQKCIKCKECS